MSHQMIAFILGMLPIIAFAGAFVYWGLIRGGLERDQRGE